ncbi:unnamed protein product [Dovyalis caffra]|uniref:Uncharacterized protein n=1 Tax=Dovyalis caffra TaxID=77055 RepID=A0AAV1RGB1_9ROSI|nr:unnamed protein product [Dovyalis caffra]
MELMSTAVHNSQGIRSIMEGEKHDKQTLPEKRGIISVCSARRQKLDLWSLDRLFRLFA